MFCWHVLLAGVALWELAGPYITSCRRRAEAPLGLWRVSGSGVVEQPAICSQHGQKYTQQWPEIPHPSAELECGTPFPSSSREYAIRITPYVALFDASSRVTRPKRRPPDRRNALRRSFPYILAFLEGTAKPAHYVTTCAKSGVHAVVL
jgi:hypothetical protein